MQRIRWITRAVALFVIVHSLGACMELDEARDESASPAPGDLAAHAPGQPGLRPPAPDGFDAKWQQYLKAVADTEEARSALPALLRERQLEQLKAEILGEFE